MVIHLPIEPGLWMGFLTELGLRMGLPMELGLRTSLVIVLGIRKKWNWVLGKFLKQEPDAEVIQKGFVNGTRLEEKGFADGVGLWTRFANVIGLGRRFFQFGTGLGEFCHMGYGL